MREFRYLIPNFFTGLSLLSALVAMYYISQNEFILAPWLIMFSIVCDFLDGKFARLLDAASPFGSLFDTMSDFVAFGIVPAFLAFQVSLQYIPYLGGLVAAMFVLSGCYRLIRFTLRKQEPGHRTTFIGLPIPMAAGFIASLVLFSLHTWNQIPAHSLFLLIVFLISILMSSRIEYLALDQESMHRKDIKLLFLFFLVSLAITLRYSYIAILFWITSYIIFCLIRHLLLVIRNRYSGVILSSTEEEK